MARWNFSLMCQPMPIARVLRALPKLAVIFLVVHVVVMIYSLLNQAPHVPKNGPPGVLDEKVKLAVDTSRITDKQSAASNLKESKLNPERWNKIKTKLKSAERQNKTKTKLKSADHRIMKEVVKLKVQR